MGEGGGNNIKVVCRIRPQNKREIAENSFIVVEPDDNEVSIRIDVSALFCVAKWRCLCIHH
jgi:hypothetical protein